MELLKTSMEDVSLAMEIIDMAKAHLKAQGIDQWQTGYPDLECLKNDALNGKGYFVKDGDNVMAYLCIDFGGEPAYDNLNGTWSSSEPYVVVHRMAMNTNFRSQGLSSTVFGLVEELAAAQGVNNFRVDTDADNQKMQHILKKTGFTYRGTIWFDNSEKIAFDKIF